MFLILKHGLSVAVVIMFRLDLNMELPQGQTGSVGTSVASAEQVHEHSLLTSTID